MKTKEQKRQEAEERKEYYKNLSFSKKIALIESRPGKSRRERERLLKQMYNQTHNA